MIIEILQILGGYYMKNPIAQSIGLIGLFFMVIGLFNKDDNKLKVIGIFGLTSFAIHFYLMGFYVAALINVIAVLRNILSKKYKNNTSIWLVISITYLSTLFLNFNNKYDLMMIIGALIVNYAYFMLEGVKFRFILLLSGITWLIYGIVSESVGGIVTNLITTIAIILGVLNIIIERNKNFYYIPNTNFVAVRIKKD